MVWQVLDELAHGMSPEDIVKAWGELVPLDAISETVQLARRSLLDKDGRLRSAKQALRASA